MFMKTGQKNLAADLFSPVAKTSLTVMSILSALFPLALSVSPQALAAPVAVAPLPVVLPVTPAPAAKPVEVKFIPPAAKPVAKPVPAVAQPAGAELVRIQAPAAMDRNAIIDRVAKAMTDTRWRRVSCWRAFSIC